MLEALFGNRTAAKVMLYLFRYREAYASAVARDLGIALSQAQRQLDRFESGNLLVSRRIGNVRLYSFNPRTPVTKRLTELLRVFYEAMPMEERERLFPARRRPRRRGKPIMKQRVR